jgi:hypothetical protein
LSYKVFLSHSFEDRLLVGPLEDSLKGVGIDPYMAEEHPDYGDELPKKIEEAIDSSQAVLVVLTKRANLSPSVNQEVGYAKKGGKLIVALVEEGVVTGVLLQGIEVVKFTTDRIHEAIGHINAYFDSLKEKEPKKKDWLMVVGLAAVIVLAFVAGYVVGKARKE